MLTDQQAGTERPYCSFRPNSNKPREREMENCFKKNAQISNFIKICPMGAQLFHDDRRTDKHDANNSRFSILRMCLKKEI